MIKKRGIILVLLILLLINICVAEDYYADITIDVDNTGLVDITGRTNHPTLLVENSEQFTSKKASYWILNISLDDNFSNLIYKLKLPKNSVINYLKLPDIGRIEDSNSGLKIIGTSNNKKFNIIVQYQIRILDNSTNLIIILLIILIIVLAGLYYYKKKFPKKTNNINIKFLTERQKLIFDIVKKNKKSITQAQIEKITKLPKSSLSRNIDSLVRKGILKKQQKGMSNLIFIKE